MTVCLGWRNDAMTHSFKWRMTDISDAVGCICISQNKFHINTCTNCQLHISGAVLCWRWISLSICNFKKHICHNIVLLLILIMWLDLISFLRTYFLHFLCLLLTKIVSLVIWHKFILLHCGFAAFVLNEWCLVPCLMPSEPLTRIQCIDATLVIYLNISF